MHREMSSRQRVLAAFRHEPPDRTPIFEYVLLPPIADKILGRTMAYGDCFTLLAQERGFNAAVWQQARDWVELAVKLHHDMMYVCPVYPPPDAEPMVFPQEPDSDDPIEIIRWRVTQRERPILPPEQAYYDAGLLIYEILPQVMKEYGVDLPLMAPAYGHGVWTDVALMQTMLLDESLTRQYFALVTQAVHKTVEKYVQLGVDMIGVGGDFAGNRGPLISPACYRKFIVPEVRRIADLAHAGAKYAINASDGNLWPVIDDFLIDSHVDGYIEIDSHAGMDLKQLKQRYGGRVTLLGNIECGNLLCFGTPEQVKQLVRECLQAGGGDGGHILCCSNAITETTPLANYLAIGEAYREFFGITAW